MLFSIAKNEEQLRQMWRNPKNLSFSDVSRVCRHDFGEPRRSRSRHAVFQDVMARQSPAKSSRYSELLRGYVRKLSLKNDLYTYRVTWSEEDQEHVGRCTGLPSLSWLDKSQELALNGIRDLVAETVKDMKENKEEVPEPLSMRKYGGKFHG